MIVRLALRLLIRELRSGELRLLFASLVLAVAASCTVGFFTDRVERALIRQATEFLGADLVVEASNPLPETITSEASTLALEQSDQTTFASMLMKEDQVLLVAIKAVDGRYPLKGKLRVADATDGTATLRAAGPPVGELWAEPRVLAQLEVRIGDTLDVGERRLRLSGILTHEPDRGGGLLSLNPRVMIHQNDVDATGLLQIGSRATYRQLFTGPPNAIARLQDWLPTVLPEGARVLDIDQENPSIGGTLKRAQRYLNLSGLLAVAMASVAIAMAARRYSERHFDTAAMLRCFGLGRQQLSWLFGTQLLLIGLSASLLGIVAGWLAQHGLVSMIASLMATSLPAAGMGPALTGVATGLLVLLAASLPPLLALSQVPPLRVLRRELAPIAAGSVLIYLISAMLAIALLWLYSGDLSLALMIGTLGVAGALVLAAVGWLSLKVIIRLPGQLSWRLATRSLMRHPQATLSQLTAFTLTLSAMALILLVRTDLIDDWKSQLPEQAPNHFLINIQPWEQQPLAEYFADNAIDHAGIYPMVRGRLAAINEQTVAERIPPGSPAERATRRELNLTWSAELAPDNRIVAGRWWQPEDYGKPLISVEKKLADDLGVSVGDRLHFVIGGEPVEARITSLRTLDWSSLRPNFFVIFAPDALSQVPATAMTSFYLPPERRNELVTLLRQFPTLTLLDIKQLLDNLRRIVDQVTLAVEYVLLFVLAAGVLVLFAGLSSSMDTRLHEGALLRSLGARSKLLQQILSLEFAILGLLAGLLAAALTTLASAWLYQLLQLTYQPNPLVWLLTPLAGVTLVTAAGRWGSRHVLRHSPLQVLREAA